MLDALLAFTILAASAPKVIHTPSATSAADVGTVALETPRRNACFGVVRVSLLLSSRKSDRARTYALSAVVADAPSLPVITGGSLGGETMKLVNVRNGDVACTDYQCPTGSSAVFEVAASQRDAVMAGGSLPLEVATSLGGCKVAMPVEKAAFEALDAWAGKLKAAS